MDKEENRADKQHSSREQMDRLSWRDIGYAAAPAFLYILLLNVVYSALSWVGNGHDIPGILLQAAAFCVCLAYFGYRAMTGEIRSRGTVHTVYRYPAAFCYVVAVVMGGVACNGLISLTGISGSSAGYRQVVEIFYGNGLWIEVAALCILGPIVEELVYRGFVYQRFCRKTGAPAAMVFSAVVFGLLHLNLVQGIYAFAVGLLLGYIMWRTNSLYTAMAAHMAVNLVSVLRTETDWLDILEQNGRGAYIVTAGCMVLMGIFLSYGDRMAKRAS